MGALRGNGGCSLSVGAVQMMLAMECGGLLGVRQSQGGAAVGGQRGGGGGWAEVAQLLQRGDAAGRARVGVRVAPGVGSGRTQLRVGVETRRRGREQAKFRVRAVASAYPPIAQTEKTFRLPIDYYQVPCCSAAMSFALSFASSSE